MLSLRTTDNWAFSVLVTVGGDAETFSNTATDTSAYEAMEAWILWLNAAGRAWSGAITFAWTWARETTTGGAELTLSAGSNFSINAGAQTLLGFAAAGPVSSTTGAAAAVGTWAPIGKIAMRCYIRQLDRGDATGDGAIRPGVPGTAHRRPALSATGTVVDAARFAAVLADAENPRKATVYQLHKDAWRTVAVGPIRRAAASFKHYRFDLEVV